MLLDENVRASFAEHLSGHEVKHVEALGMKSIRNGELITYARQNFDALITLDRGILFQHNHSNQRLRILVLRVRNSTIESLIAKREAAMEWLSSSSVGDLAEI